MSLTLSGSRVKGCRGNFDYILDGCLLIGPENHEAPIASYYL